MRGVATRLAVVALASFGAAEAVAQGNPTANVGGGGGAFGGSSEAAAVHQGANTTDGTTPGYSGPDEPSPLAPGEIRPPGPPQPELCDPYRDTPAFETCLGKVLVER